MSKSVMKYGLGHIRPYHKEIARRLVLGKTQTEVGEELRISSSRMSIIVNSPLFKNELRKLEALRDKGVGDIGETLRELAPIALEQVERTMYFGSSDRLRMDAAESILDRAGVSRVTKTQVSGNVSHNHTSYTAEELRNLVIERVERMKRDKEIQDKMIEDANATEIEYDEIPNIDENKKIHIISGGER